jgi:hypothetical protein
MPLQDIVDRLASPDSKTEDLMFQQYELNKAGTDRTPLMVAAAMTPECIDTVKFKKMLAEKQVPGQGLFIDVYQEPDISTTNNLIPSGFTEVANVVRVPILTDLPISKKLTINMNTTDRWDAGVFTDMEKWEHELYFKMIVMQMSIAEEQNNRVKATLVGNKATLGGTGFNFIVDGGGYREIPGLYSEDHMTMIESNCTRDRYHVQNGKKITLLGSTEMKELYMRYAKRSEFNESQQDKSLIPFDFYHSASIDPINSSTDKGLLWAINSGSLYVETFVNDYTIPTQWASKDKSLEVVRMPAIPKRNLPAMTIGLYVDRQISNLYTGVAPFNFEDSRITPVTNFMGFTYSITGTSYSSTPNRRPIVGYRWKS